MTPPSQIPRMMRTVRKWWYVCMNAEPLYSATKEVQPLSEEILIVAHRS